MTVREGLQGAAPTAESGFGGSIAIVTGAASGIGLATATALSRAGAHVYGLDIVPGNLAGVATWVPCDVRDEGSVAEAVHTVQATHAWVDVLVNNAGVGAVGSVDGADPEDWLRVFDVNVFGAARTTRAFLPLLRMSARGAIVNTCSVAASIGLQRRVVYSASKGAVEAMTRAMAADLVGESIRVNCVNPGTAETPWVTRLINQAADPVAERAALERRQPNGRFVAPEEVAAAICFLADPRQSAITGTVLAVDGGMHALQLSP